MKTRISIPLVCLAAVCVFAVPDVQAGDFGPRASHVRRVQASTPIGRHFALRIVRAAGPRQTVPVVRDVRASAQLAAVVAEGCSGRRAGPRATVCL